MVQVFFCPQCKANFMLDGWNSKTDTCKGCTKPAKYRNTPVWIDGFRFASLGEGNLYQRLKSRMQVGEIRDLRIHPKFKLEVNGQVIATYTADFQYVEVETNSVVVMDWKSLPTITQLYKRNKKHMKAQYGIDIVEVME